MSEETAVAAAVFTSSHCGDGKNAGGAQWCACGRALVVDKK